MNNPPTTTSFNCPQCGSGNTALVNVSGQNTGISGPTVRKSAQNLIIQEIEIPLQNNGCGYVLLIAAIVLTVFCTVSILSAHFLRDTLGDYAGGIGIALGWITATGVLVLFLQYRNRMADAESNRMERQSDKQTSFRKCLACSNKWQLTP